MLRRSTGSLVVADGSVMVVGMELPVWGSVVCDGRSLGDVGGVAMLNACTTASVGL